MGFLSLPEISFYGGVYLQFVKFLVAYNFYCKPKSVHEGLKQYKIGGTSFVNFLIKIVHYF